MSGTRGSKVWSVCAALVACVVAVRAGEGRAAGPDPVVLKSLRTDGIAFLRNTQGDDGSWTTDATSGITGLVVLGLLQGGLPAEDPAVAKGLKKLESYAQPDGGLYAPDSSHRNYETAIALMAFAAANKDGRYKNRIAAAEKFLRGLQWDQGEGIEDADPAFGGAGYGKHKRPDLSNTQFLLDALKAAGAKSDDPAVQNALKFVSRCQNLETEHNTTPFAAKVDDGGFYYSPAAGGSSQAGPTDNGGLRSYASMTYAGLKSMIYAGVKPDDPRVKAARAWIARNYSLEENPGLGQTGIYYYYHTFAKTMAAAGGDTFEDARGKKHEWRTELVARLASLRKANGSWVNSADRWNEGDPNLVTAYALMALSYCDAPAAK